MKISKCTDAELFSAISNEFKAQTVSDEYPAGIVLFSDSELTKIDHDNHYEDLKASSLAEKYANDEVSKMAIAKIIVNKYKRNWERFFGVQKYEYNPGWNVDGQEKRVIETEFGKIVINEQLESGSETTTFGKEVTNEQLVDGTSTTEFGKITTDEQLVDSTVTTQFGKEVTNEQLTDGHSNTTNNLTDQTTHISDKQVDSYLYGYDADTISPSSRTVEDGGEDKVTHTGTANTALSDGKKKASEGGSETITTDGGKSSSTDSGSETVTTNSGKTKSTDGGTESVISNDGTHKSADSGTEKVTDTYTRGGNIGVTETTQLLQHEIDFWSSYNFITLVYKDINKELTIPIWE